MRCCSCHLWVAPRLARAPHKLGAHAQLPVAVVVGHAVAAVAMRGSNRAREPARAAPRASSQPGGQIMATHERIETIPSVRLWPHFSLANEMIYGGHRAIPAYVI